MLIKYHYTSVETLYNMLTKSVFKEETTNVNYLEFRAMHFMSLNDPLERQMFINQLINKVSKVAENKLTDDELDKLKKLCYIDAYVISLSDSKLFDDLNMWRGYGGNGVGVCLEFDFAKIECFYKTSKNKFYKMENAYKLFECQYLNQEEIPIDDDLVRKIYDVLKQNNQQTMKEASLIKQISEEAMKYKHKAYESEKEWRFVINSTASPEFYKNGNIIKAYLKFKIPIDALVSITLGPCIKDSYEILSLKQFIKYKLGSDFEIKYS